MWHPRDRKLPRRPDKSQRNAGGSWVSVLTRTESKLLSTFISPPWMLNILYIYIWLLQKHLMAKKFKICVARKFGNGSWYSSPAACNCSTIQSRCSKPSAHPRDHSQRLNSSHVSWSALRGSWVHVRSDRICTRYINLDSLGRNHRRFLRRWLEEKGFC